MFQTTNNVTLDTFNHITYFGTRLTQKLNLLMEKFIQ